MKKISVMLLALLLLCSMLLCTACDDNSETTTTTTAATTTTTTRAPATTRPPLKSDTPLSQKLYEIGDKDELLDLINDMIANNWWMDGITIKLTADIYLNEVDDPEWYLKPDVVEWPLAGATTGQYPFQGTIDGQGHTIYGLYAKAEKTTSTKTMVAFLPQVTGTTTIKNLALRNGYLEGTASHVAYDAPTADTAEKYYSTDELLVSSFVGFSNASSLTVENCYSDLTLKAISKSPVSKWGSPSARIGGLIGFCKQSSGSAQYLFNNLAFYGELLGERGNYLLDAGGTITTGASSAQGSIIHMAGLAVGSQHDAMAIRYTNCVIVPSNVVKAGGNLACVVETTGYKGASTPPMVKNVYTSIPLYAGNASTELAKHEYTYFDSWADREQTTCMANMTDEDFLNIDMLMVYGENFTWYNGGEFSSTNCWTYNANDQLIQQMFLLPEASA